MSHYHAVVWLDHAEARVFQFTAEAFEKHNAHTAQARPHLHHKRGAVGSGHLAEDHAYLGQIVKLLEGAREILVVGPGTAKLELIKYIHRHHRDLEARVVGVETVDHPSDGQLLGYARHYFEAKDRMIG
jgi:stalled ribosome rescue protein Dom34